MIVEIFQKQEEMKAKKEFLKNVSKIYDLEDICTVIDELVERMEDVKPEFKDKFVQSLKDMKFDIENERLEMIPIEYDKEFIQNEYLPKLEILTKCLKEGVFPCKVQD